MVSNGATEERSGMHAQRQQIAGAQREMMQQQQQQQQQHQEQQQQQHQEQQQQRATTGTKRTRKAALSAATTSPLRQHQEEQDQPQGALARLAKHTRSSEAPLETNYCKSSTAATVEPRTRAGSRHSRNASGASTASAASTPSMLLDADFMRSVLHHPTFEASDVVPEHSFADAELADVVEHEDKRRKLAEYSSSSSSSDMVAVMSITFSSLAQTEGGLVKHVASFLSLQDTVALVQTSWAILRGMRGCPLRLDQLQRVFDPVELEHLVLGGAALHEHAHMHVGAPELAAVSDGRAPIRLDSDVDMMPQAGTDVDVNEGAGQVDASSHERQLNHQDPEGRQSSNDGGDDDDDDDDAEMVTIPSSSHDRLTEWTITGVRARCAPALEHLLWRALHRKELARLILTGDVDWIDAAELKDSHKLECLDAGVCCRRLENADTLRTLPRLSHLYVRNARNLVNADFVPATHQLQELSLYMCRNLTSIDALAGCSELRVLDLGGCKRLESIEPLRSCRALEKLSIADCARLTSAGALVGHDALHHLDVSGCVGFEDLGVLLGLKALRLAKLKRCNAGAMLPLLGAENDIVSREATHNLLHHRLSHVDALLPQLLQLIRDCMPAAAGDVLANVLAVLSAFAYREGLRSTTFLANSGAVPVLLELGCRRDASAQLRKLCFEVVARVSQTREAVPEVARHRTARRIVDELKYTLDEGGAASENPAVLEMLQYSASTLLFIAAVEGQREQLMLEAPDTIGCLVRLVEVGTPETVAEAAGALWNLAASLQIGQAIVRTPGAVPALAGVLRTGSITAKLQAAGALRNLAILDPNKEILAAGGVVQPLVVIIQSRAAALSAGASLLLQSSRSDDAAMLVVKAAATLRILSTRETVQTTAGALGAIPALVNLLGDRSGALRRQAAGALLALSFHKVNRAAIVAANGIPECVRILSTSRNDSMVVSAAGVLWQISAEEGVERQIAQHPRALPALIERLQSDNVDVVVRVAGALRALAYEVSAKELIVLHGGVPLLARHIRPGAPLKALTQALATLRLVAAGSVNTRSVVAASPAMEALAALVKSGPAECRYLALSTLAHVAPYHVDRILAHLSVADLAAMRVSENQLVADDATYILQRVAIGQPAGVHLEAQHPAAAMRRIRGTPGDVRIDADGTVVFYSYSSVAATSFATRGKIGYQVLVRKISDSPSFGFVSSAFTAKDVCCDYGVGFPASDPRLQDGWALDPVSGRLWPNKGSFEVSRLAPGDVVTVIADLDQGTIHFALNDDEPRLAFAGLRESNACFAQGLAPAISASHGTQLVVKPLNFLPGQ